MRMTSAVLALCVCFSAPVAVQAEFLDGLEQEILTSPASRLSAIESAAPVPGVRPAVPDAALAAFDAAFFHDMHEAETAALIARSLAAPADPELALAPEMFLDPREAETAALIAASLIHGSSELAALQPELFLDPYEAETTALIVAALTETQVETTGSIAPSHAEPSHGAEDPWAGIVLP